MAIYIAEEVALVSLCSAAYRRTVSDWFCIWDVPGKRGFVVGACPACCRVLSSVPGLYLLEASHIPAPLPSGNNQRCLQKLTNVPEGGGRRGQHLPQLRATALSQRWYLPERGKREVGSERNQMSFLSIKVLTSHWEQKSPERKNQGTWTTQKRPTCPRRPGTDCLREKQQRGGEGDPRREGASLCLRDTATASQGSTGPVPRKAFSPRLSVRGRTRQRCHQ